MLWPHMDSSSRWLGKIREEVIKLTTLQKLQIQVSVPCSRQTPFRAPKAVKVLVVVKPPKPTQLASQECCSSRPLPTRCQVTSLRVAARRVVTNSSHTRIVVCCLRIRVCDQVTVICSRWRLMGVVSRISGTRHLCICRRKAKWGQECSRQLTRCRIRQESIKAVRTWLSE